MPVDPIHLSNVTVHLGPRRALDRVSFTLESGTFLALLGGNGSGKTTLVRAALGLLPLHEGTRTLFGEDPARFGDRSRIGYVPQRFTAATGVPATVFEVVLSGRVGRARGWRRFSAADRDAATTALVTVDMADRASSPVAGLSGGQQQRVLIARALATEPDLLVLDEPLAGVDASHRDAMIATLGQRLAAGTTILMVAHDLRAMETLVRRTVVLDAGRVVYDGPVRPEHLVAKHVHHDHDEPGVPA